MRRKKNTRSVSVCADCHCLVINITALALSFWTRCTNGFSCIYLDADAMQYSTLESAIPIQPTTSFQRHEFCCGERVFGAAISCLSSLRGWRAHHKRLTVRAKLFTNYQTPFCTVQFLAFGHCVNFSALCEKMAHQCTNAALAITRLCGQSVYTKKYR